MGYAPTSYQAYNETFLKALISRVKQTIPKKT